MWVNTFGTAYRVHRLTSPDGLHWQWAKRYGPDGEFGTGDDGTFDDHQRSYPSIVSANEGLRCWFTGNIFGATGMGYAVLPQQAVNDTARNGEQTAAGDADKLRP